MGEQTGAGAFLKPAYEKLKASELQAAYNYLEQALSVDFRNEEVKYALKCVHWWIEHLGKLDDIEDPYDKGCYIISLLRHYSIFLEQFENLFEQCQYAVRFFVYTRALYFFEGLLHAKPENRNDGELLFLAGKCHKALGNYETAFKYAKQAMECKKEDSRILAAAADLYELLSETKYAKVLFREAFFLDPAKIELNALESGMIKELWDDVYAMGYSTDLICEWIPVYGNVRKVFNVKRELKPMEAGRLKQSIFSLETEYELNPEKKESLKPRLLNHYFWLIDHYENTNEEPSLTDEILLKIKIIDPDIYQMYSGDATLK